MVSGRESHGSTELGREPSAIIGIDAPNIGSPANVTLAGIVERESGVTPAPPPVSVRAVVIALVAMLVIGGALYFGFVRLVPHGQSVSDQWELPR